MTHDILTRRLTLRPWRPSDVDRYLEIYADARVWRWLGANPQPVTERANALAKIERWAALIDGPYGIWAAEPVESNSPAGTVILLRLPDANDQPTNDVEVGWHFAPDSWGQGYATEAADALLDHAWQFGIPRVHAVVYPTNERSIAVCERLGMTDAGLTSQWYGTELRHFVIEQPPGY